MRGVVVVGVLVPLLLLLLLLLRLLRLLLRVMLQLRGRRRRCVGGLLLLLLVRVGPRAAGKGVVSSVRRSHEPAGSARVPHREPQSRDDRRDLPVNELADEPSRGAPRNTQRVVSACSGGRGRGRGVRSRSCAEPCAGARK